MAEDKKKRGKGFTLAVLLLILVILTGVLIGVKAYNSAAEERENSESAGTVMMTVNTDEIDTFSYNVDDMVYEFHLGDEGWEFQGDTAQELDQEAVDAMLVNVLNLTTDTIVSENLDNASDYGLDSPVFTLSIKFTDGTEKVLRIGSENPMLDVYYAYIEDDERIFTVGSEVQSSFVTLENLISQDDSEEAADEGTDAV